MMRQAPETLLVWKDEDTGAPQYRPEAATPGLRVTNGGSAEEAITLKREGGPLRAGS